MTFAEEPMNQELPGLISEANAIAADAQRQFGQLSHAQLNWKARPDDWSVGQCFDHLIRINSGYFPVLRQIADGSYAPSWKERLPLLPRLFGSLVLKAVQRDAPRKFKAAKHVRPSASDLDGSIIAAFVSHQREVIDYMKRTGHLDLRAVVITSPVAPIAMYSVLDAYRIIVAHERRHMAQAERVMNEAQFPPPMRR